MKIQECRRLLGRDDLTDGQIAEFLVELDNFIDPILDEMFRDEFEPDAV